MTGEGENKDFPGKQDSEENSREVRITEQTDSIIRPELLRHNVKGPQDQGILIYEGVNSENEACSMGSFQRLRCV